MPLRLVPCRAKPIVEYAADKIPQNAILSLAQWCRMNGKSVADYPDFFGLLGDESIHPSHVQENICGCRDDLIEKLRVRIAGLPF